MNVSSYCFISSCDPYKSFFSQIKLNISLIECARQLCYFLQQNEIMLHGQFNFNDCRAKKRQHKERSCVGSSRKILFIECKAINASIEPIERWKINFLCPTYTQKKSLLKLLWLVLLIACRKTSPLQFTLHYFNYRIGCCVKLVANYLDWWHHCHRWVRKVKIILFLSLDQITKHRINLNLNQNQVGDFLLSIFMGLDLSN